MESLLAGERAQAEETLFRLLHDAAFRKDYFLDPSETFSEVDLDQLEKSARRVLQLGHELIRTFPRSASNPKLVEEFLASPEYRRTGQISLSGYGLSAEEGFFQFCSRDPLFSDPVSTAHSILVDEFVGGMIRILASNPAPDFRVESSLLHRRDDGWLAVTRPEGRWTLHAVAGGKYISGAISDAVAKQLLSDIAAS